jgi:hypothetical protein
MNNMMRKNNNRGGNKHRSGGNGGGQRRYNNNGGGGNRNNQNDGQNLQRQKHHATQQLGKYGDLARNAQINGDRVDVEYYLQHVDHYTRVLTDIAAIEAERFAHSRESQIIPGGPNDPNAQAQHAENASIEGENGGEAGGEPSANDSGNASDAQGEFTPNNQPRMSRQRRPHFSEPIESRDNGAKEANSNTSEIPLPGGILPPI